MGKVFFGKLATLSKIPAPVILLPVIEVFKDLAYTRLLTICPNRSDGRHRQFLPVACKIAAGNARITGPGGLLRLHVGQALLVC